MRQFKATVIAVTLLLSGWVFGFDPDRDHPIMTQLAIDNSSISQYLRENLRISSSSLFDYPFALSTEKNYIELLKEGSRAADYENGGDFDHYFDPHTQSGLSDGYHSGQSSFFLAEQYWSDAFDAYELALTQTQQSARAQHYGDLFVNLGRILHLVQDLGDPAHTRNDGPIVPGELNLTESSIAYYLYDSPISVTPVEYNTLEQYWFNAEENYYPVDDPASQVCFNPGLADLSNNSYFSEETLPNGCCSYSFPPTTSSAYLDYDCDLDWATSAYQCYDDPCMGGKRHVMFERTLPYRKCIESGNCTSEYTCSDNPFLADFRLGPYAYWNTQEIMAPYIISYSAGLIDHFFTGELKVTISPSSTEGYNDVTIINVSRGTSDLIDGTLSFYWKKNVTNEVFEIESSEQTGFSLSYGQSTQFSIPAIPDELLEGQEIADTLYTVVYRGMLGSNDGFSFQGEANAVIGKKVYPDVDRGRIYFVAEDQSTNYKSIRSVRHDGADLRTHYVATDSCSFNLDSGSVSPDGKWVLFSEAKDCVPESTSAYFCMLNTETDQITCNGPYTPTPQSYVPPNSWNSDSTEAVVILEDGWDAAPGSHLWVMQTDGAIRELAYSPTWGGWIWGGESRFTSDDSEVLFDAYGPDPDPDVWTEDYISMWKIPSGGGTITRVSDPNFIDQGWEVRTAVSNPWSENVLYGPKNTYGTSEVWEYGTNPHGNVSHYQWNQDEYAFSTIHHMTSSPDELYLSWVVSSNTPVYRVLPEDLAQSSAIARYATTTMDVSGFQGTPFWSPTSQRLAYLPDAQYPDEIMVQPISGDHTQQQIPVTSENVNEYVYWLLGWGGGEAGKEIDIFEPKEGETFYRITDPYQPIDVRFHFSPSINPTTGQFIASLTKGTGSFSSISIDDVNLEGSCQLIPNSGEQYEIKIEFVPNEKTTAEVLDINRIRVLSEGFLKIQYYDQSTGQIIPSQKTTIDNGNHYSELTYVQVSLEDKDGNIITNNPQTSNDLFLEELPNAQFDDPYFYDNVSNPGDIDGWAEYPVGASGISLIHPGLNFHIGANGYSEPILLRSFLDSIFDISQNPVPITNYITTIKLTSQNPKIEDSNGSLNIQQWVNQYYYHRDAQGNIVQNIWQQGDPYVTDWLEAKFWDEVSLFSTGERSIVFDSVQELAQDNNFTVGSLYEKGLNAEVLSSSEGNPAIITWQPFGKYSERDALRRNRAATYNEMGLHIETNAIFTSLIHHEARHCWQFQYSEANPESDVDHFPEIQPFGSDSLANILVDDHYQVNGSFNNPEFELKGPPTIYPDAYYTDSASLWKAAIERDCNKYQTSNVQLTSNVSAIELVSPLGPPPVIAPSTNSFIDIEILTRTSATGKEMSGVPVKYSISCSSQSCGQFFIIYNTNLSECSHAPQFTSCTYEYWKTSGSWLDPDPTENGKSVIRYYPPQDATELINVTVTITAYHIDTTVNPNRPGYDDGPNGIVGSIDFNLIVDPGLLTTRGGLFQ